MGQLFAACAAAKLKAATDRRSPKIPVIAYQTTRIEYESREFQAEMDEGRCKEWEPGVSSIRQPVPISRVTLPCVLSLRPSDWPKELDHQC